MAGAWIHLKKKGLEFVPLPPVQSSTQHFKKAPGTKIHRAAHRSSPLRKSTLGGNHVKNSTNRRHLEDRRLRKNEADSGSHQETEGITSIYQESKESELADSSGRRLVPVKGYLASQRRRLPDTLLAPSDEGIRLYVQCIEFRKGAARETSESECGALARQGARRHLDY